jgi:hypothetical protein
MNLGFSGSYTSDDVVFLLNPIEIDYTSLELKEQHIASGARHYSQMICREEKPTSEYLDFFYSAFLFNANRMAEDLNYLAFYLAKKYTEGFVLVSFARAGTPPGIVLARLIRNLGVECFHFSISIIIGMGFDNNAILYIQKKYPSKKIVFFDGWTGKGTIANEYRSSINGHYNKIQFVKDSLFVVIADLCGASDLSASSEDYLIPSGIIGGIISGLISRSIYIPSQNSDVFHSCKYLGHLDKFDISKWFVDSLYQIALKKNVYKNYEFRDYLQNDGKKNILELKEYLLKKNGTSSLEKIKVGINETTRAILRRKPKEIIIKRFNDIQVGHLVFLCQQKDIKINEDFRCPFLAIASL